VSDRPRILIVDDDTEICRTLEVQFFQGGYEAQSVYDVSSALVRLANESFDLVLVDLVFPDVSGIDLLRMIRKAKNEIPVIVLTGHESLSTAITATSLHISGYLTKSTTTGPDLLDAVERALADRPAD